MTKGSDDPSPMKVLVTGASGLIGRRLARALADRGHEVVAASRRPRPGPGQSALAVDFAEAPGAHWWAERLRDVDVVVNAVGIFREQGRQRFEVLHARAPIALFEGAARAGVRLVVQLSALGSDGNAATAYHRSKHRADEALRKLPVASVIVQPSLVHAPEGASAQLFRRLAMLPVLALPAGKAEVQPVHVEDLVEAIVRMVESAPIGSATVAVVGPEPMALERYLARLRRAMGVSRRAWRLPLPTAVALGAARVLAHLPGSLVDPDAIRMLLRSRGADPSAFAGWLGRAPRPVESFVRDDEKRALAREATLSNLAVVARLSVAAVWIWTGLVSLGLFPVADSLALLSDFGLQGAPALVALYGGATLDLILGVLTLAAPARWMGRIWCAQLVVIAGYTVLITLRMPHWWLHPYGPLTKNLPMMAVIGMLWTMHRER